MTTHEPTKSDILASYLAQLQAVRPLVYADLHKLDNARRAAEETLNGGNAVDRQGHCWLRALELNGLIAKKDQTLKRLHALNW